MDLPIRPMVTNRSASSGRAPSSSENSSTMTSRCGIGSRSGRCVRSAVYSCCELRFPAAASISWRRCSSPPSASRNRSTIGGAGLQVGDHSGHLRQPGESGKRCATLEVDQQQGQRRGGVPDGQRGHQRPEQFRFPRPGRADHQTVRAMAAACRLLQVQHHRLANGIGADGCTQQIACAAPPTAKRDDVLRCADRSGRPGAAGRGGGVVRRRAQRRERPRHRQRLDLAEPVEEAPHGSAARSPDPHRWKGTRRDRRSPPIRRRR